MYHIKILHSIIHFEKFKVIKFETFLIFSDTMKDLCYAKYQGGQCTNAFPSATTKSSCCCSLGTPGQISAWGTLCMPCPNPNSPEFQMLCPHGSGMTYNGDGKFFFLTLHPIDLSSSHFNKKSLDEYM